MTRKFAKVRWAAAAIGTLVMVVAPVALALTLTPPPAEAAKPTPLTFSRWLTTIQQPVEQQSPGFPDGEGSGWVYNPTPCAWDVDDNLIDFGFSPRYLSPGASATAQQCLIADRTLHLLGVWVDSPSPKLLVTLDVEPDFGGCGQLIGQKYGCDLSLAPAPDGRAYRYQDCVIAPTYNEPLPPVPDSNLGGGVPTTVMLTVRNPTPRTIRDLGGKLELTAAWNWALERYCPTG